MSSSKNNTTYKKTSFLVGNNSEFINEFYADYLSDPKSIPDSWRQFFEGLKNEGKKFLGSGKISEVIHERSNFLEERNKNHPDSNPLV